MHKSTYIDSNSRRRVHRWTDLQYDFLAEVYKEDGQWVVIIDSGRWETGEYRSAVDIVMDEYRLAKFGYSSWEEAAAGMAEGPWEELSDEERRDLINAARQMARSAS